MFKNASIYRIDFTRLISEGLFHENPYVPCAPTQEHASGWVPPRGEEHGALVEIAPGGIRVVKLAIETRKVPAQAVRAALDERIKLITAETGKKPGRKLQKELKEEITRALLPKAFSKVNQVMGWIDQNNGLVVIDTSSHAVCDLFITMLVRSLPEAIFRSIATAESPSACMTAWLLDDTTPDCFDIGRSCVLESGDESRASVRFKNHALDVDDVQDHIRAGKQAKALEVSWRGRLQFTITEDLRLRGIKFLDMAFEQPSEVEAADAFDADLAITSGELTQAIKGIIEAFGGQPTTF